MKEALHVLVQCEDYEEIAKEKLRRAVECIRYMLIPPVLFLSYNMFTFNLSDKSICLLFNLSDKSIDHMQLLKLCDEI